ncbi:SIR2 family protein [Paenibacillus tepidiphilus]|uniref:SIR2 family protein n=1 Tax=Paenibacillus tepidiphilus TaxID=2608683 RepID=UPI00123A067F|nr:SIR2 family protein [Paenibacillus tepidiphilus]
MRNKYSDFIDQTFKLNPVLIVGSGISAGAGISGMGKLASYLSANVQVDKLNENERTIWFEIKSKLAIGLGLEEVLQNSGEAVSNKLLQEIILHTWCCISTDEQKLLLDISTNADPTGFVRYFLKYITSNTKVIHIITTNYDHLIEWSSSKAGWRIWDGFNEGSIGSPLSIDKLNEQMIRTVKTGKNLNNITHPHLRIYKPHGSLSWFKIPNGDVMKVPGVGTHLIPLLEQVRLTPTIVTPGTGKYLETHMEPYYTILSEMKQALSGCNALMFLGFGFNDLHIQGSFEPLLRNDSIPKIILAMELSTTAKALIEKGAIKNFVAVQKVGDYSEIISDKFEPFILQEPNHWMFTELLNQAWGAESYAATPRSI